MSIPALPRGFTPLVALSVTRLRATKGVRFGVVAAALVLAFVGAAMIIVRIVDGDGVAFDGVVASAGPWALWLAGGGAALGAASGRAARDRDDGLDRLIAARGIAATTLGWARAVAAALVIAALVGTPLVVLALLSTLLAGSGAAAAHGLLHVLGAALFALVSGGVLGLIAELCGRTPRGRGLLVAVVLGTWALAKLIGTPALSVSGGLSALLGALA